MERYIIGADCYDESASAYVVATIDEKGNLRIVESKNMYDSAEFEKEIERASRLYNAEILHTEFPPQKTEKRVYGSTIKVTPEIKKRMQEYFEEYLKKTFE